MGVSIASEGGGNKHRSRSLDADLNLVPFIDLLSMCICFLLMTAVWIELGSVQVKQLVGTEVSEQSQKAPLDLEVKFTSSDNLDLILKKNGRAAKSTTVKVNKSEDRETLIRDNVLSMFKALGYPATADSKGLMAELVSSAKITPHTSASYGDLVSVMDVLRGIGIVNLGVIPTPVR